MSSPVLFDILDVLLSFTFTNPPERLPPPMARAEVMTQQLYTDDCTTMRDGIELTCQAAFAQDLQRAYKLEEKTQNGKDH